MTNKRTATNMGIGVIGAGRCYLHLSNMAAVVRAGQTSVNILSYLVNQLSRPEIG